MMAESNGAAEQKGQPTPYVVLECVTVLLVEEEPDHGIKGGESFEAWVPRGQATTKGEVKAIEAVVGSDQEGTYKAVALRSWKGGVERVTTVRNTPFEDDELADHTPADE
jgi:uncharacterized membrane protein